VDPTKGGQMIRGTCILPAGTGNEVRVAVFADEEFHSSLKDIGTDIIGDASLLLEIANGTMNFDKIIATPEQMPSLKALARILGPKGLMPNVKSGTLVKPDVLLESVKQSKQGLVEYRVTEDGTIMNKIGILAFDNEDLIRNAEALIHSVASKKPDSVKGRFFKQGIIKTSMGPPLKLDLTKY